MNELALFAGAGGGILGGKLLGWRTVCAVEWEPYPASVLCARQNDGLLPTFPIWDDVQTFDGRPWRGIVQVVSGGFPCQDISVAGGGGESQGKNQECGNIWQESLAKLDPNTSLWKTPQFSLLEDLELSLQTFPRWGSMQNGALYPLQTLVLRTAETEFGFMPTPTSSTVGANHNSPTTLSGKRFTMNLAGYAQKFPTPTAHLSKETNAPSEALRNQPSLSSIVGGKLNPTWVEWLMAFPLGWTDLKPLEMHKFQQWQQQHGNY